MTEQMPTHLVDHDGLSASDYRKQLVEQRRWMRERDLDPNDRSARLAARGEGS